MRLQINKGYKWFRFQKKTLDKVQEKQKTTMVVARQLGKTELGANLMSDFLFCYSKRTNPVGIICMLSQDQAYKWYFRRLDKFLSKLPKSIYSKQGGKDKPIEVSFKRPHFGDTARVVITGVGNAKALRGGTCDFMILDEMASYPPGLWKSIFEPMLDRTGGKALLTSTPNGQNMFYELCKRHKAKQDTDPEVGHIEYDIYSAKVHNPEWIEKKKQSYEELGRLDEFAREYENSFTAASEVEAPFANLVHNLPHTGGLIEKDHFAINMVNKITVSVDIGAPGNMACWHWCIDPMSNAVIIRDYTDHHVGLKGLLDDLYNLHCMENRHVHIIFPVDVNTPSLEEGGTLLAGVSQHMSDKGYDRVMQVSHLPKVKSKAVLWRQGVNMWQRCRFLWSTCSEGLNKLAGVRFRKIASTEEIKYGEAAPNGCQHAADAYLYLCASLLDEVVPAGGVLPPSVEDTMRPVFENNKYSDTFGTNQYRRKQWR